MGTRLDPPSSTPASTALELWQLATVHRKPEGTPPFVRQNGIITGVQTPAWTPSRHRSFPARFGTRSRIIAALNGSQDKRSAKVRTRGRGLGGEAEYLTLSLLFLFEGLDPLAPSYTFRSWASSSPACAANRNRTSFIPISNSRVPPLQLCSFQSGASRQIAPHSDGSLAKTQVRCSAYDEVTC